MCPEEDAGSSPAPRIGAHEAAVLFLIAVAFDLLGDWRGALRVLNGRLFNPDSYMRLVRIEAGLRSGHIGYLIPRGASGAGFILHWSHLLDSLLLTASAPLEPLLGWHRALFWVGAASGPISVGLLAIAVVWASAPLAQQRYRWWGAIAIGVSLAIDGYGRFGVIHHHVLLVLVAVMVSGYAFRAAAGQEERRASIAAAAWLAFGLWLSPEAWPFGVLALGALGVAWLTGIAAAARALAVAGFALTLLLGAILLVDPPPGPAIAFDHVSLVHLALAGAIALLGAGLAAIDRFFASRARQARTESFRVSACGHAPILRAVLGIALAAILLGLWGELFLRALLGPAGLTSTPGAALMLNAISEMRPVFRLSFAIAFLFTGFFGVAAAGWLAWRRRSWLGAYGSICGLFLLALGLRYLRFSPYAEAFGAAMLAPVLTEISRQRSVGPVAQVLCRVGLLALFLLFPRVAPALDHGLQRTIAALKAAPSCALQDVAGRFGPYAGEVVLADPNLTPELFYRTDLKTVGSGYVRNVPGFLRARAAWRATPGATEPAAVRASAARLLLFCVRPGRSSLLAGAKGPTLLEALGAGHVPPWLHLLWQDKASGNTLYRIAG
jgi:hypothetical protein